MSKLKIFSWYGLLALVLFVAAVFYTYRAINPPEPNWVTTQVERGSVSETVAVSGFVEAVKTANLSFSSSGLVTGVLVKEGDSVLAGQVLATLGASQLVAERREAVSAITSAEAALAQTVAGPRAETISLSNTNLKNAEDNLARVTSEENRKVKNAQVALLSSGLEVVAVDPDEVSPAPIVSGTYTCEEEGAYTLQMYRAGSESGYAYTFSGLESGTEGASANQPGQIGDCGLFIQFSAGQSYGTSKWTLSIPNTRSGNYQTLKNAYDLARTQGSNAKNAATDALTLARDQAAVTTAPARTQEVTQGSAAISQAQARVEAIDARLRDLSIVAPFGGIITDISVVEGESAQSTPVITLLSNTAFTLTARIPEIDITKIAVNQKVSAIFDAERSETLTGTITYVAPAAIKIDGVAYFETTIVLETTPTWLKAGMNADVDIITKSKEAVLRLPKRFVTTDSTGNSFVRTPAGTNTATTSVEILFAGNDSFVEISGLSEGATVIAP
jgi:multidrug efflux pump subunit AcrA (membrane-fusion protein)